MILLMKAPSTQSPFDFPFTYKETAAMETPASCATSFNFAMVEKSFHKLTPFIIAYLE